MTEFSNQDSQTNTPRIDRKLKLTKVRFRPLNIPEATNKELVDHYLTACLLGNLPGFIIRKEVKQELNIVGHENLVEFVRESLLEQGAVFKAGPTKTKVKPHGVGELHTDGVEAVEKVLNFNVHSTVRGSGNLLFALPGSASKNLIDAESKGKPGFGTLEVRSVWEEPLHTLALSQETYTELIDPNGVFIGRAHKGDSIVIALESGKGPMFHRFDTDTEDREVLITELNRPE